MFDEWIRSVLREIQLITGLGKNRIYHFTESGRATLPNHREARDAAGARSPNHTRVLCLSLFVLHVHSCLHSPKGRPVVLSSF